VWLPPAEIISLKGVAVVEAWVVVGKERKKLGTSEPTIATVRIPTKPLGQ
jgi:hypothetical protein